MSRPLRADVLVVSAVAALAASSAALAEDAATAAPDQHRVEVENDRVRVLRVTYAPGESSPMHGHPANVTVFLTDASARFTRADGSTVETEYAAGDVVWSDGSEHAVLNLGEETVEAVIIELKP